MDFHVPSRPRQRISLPEKRKIRMLEEQSNLKVSEYLRSQVAEAVAIQNCKADLVLNSKAEWEQPTVERLIVTRELPDQEERRGGMGRGRRHRGAQQ